MTTYVLNADNVHYKWDNALPACLEVESGDTIEVITRGGEDRGLNVDSSHACVERHPFRGHALTGPVAIRGARPGDVLQIEVLDMETRDWGYTLIAPGRGLLPEQFPGPYLAIWDISDGRFARRDGIAIPIEPFFGCLGVAPGAPGPHSTIPPRRVGGNLDVKQLTAGASLYLPIEVEGALFSVGDGHAAQGDGEVCVTAIETGMVGSLRLTLRRDLDLAGPAFEVDRQLGSGAHLGPSHGVTGIARDPHEAVKEAASRAIAYLADVRGLSPEEAYVLTSVAVDLRLSEVVNDDWVVTALIPLSVLTA